MGTPKHHPLISAERVLEKAAERGLRPVVEEAFLLSEKLLGASWESPAGRPRLAANRTERAMRRFLMAGEVRGRGMGFFLLPLERSRLYPGVGRKLKFWAFWMAEGFAARLGRTASAPESGRATS